MSSKLPLQTRLFHGLGSVAYGIKDNGFSTFLLLFYNQVIGIDARLVSAALMLALFIDAFADPIIGHLSDRTYTRWGRRLPWLYIAPIPLAFAWMLMWSPPDLTGGALFVYLVLVAILVRTLVSCCEVPSAALVPELTLDYDERTALMRFRYLFGWAGGLFVMFLAYTVFLVPTETYAVGQLNPEGYWRYGLAGAIIIAASVLISAAGQHRRVAKLPATKPIPTSVGHAFGEIRESLSHPAFLVLMGAAAIAFTSQGVTFSIANYLYIYVWEFSAGAFAVLPWMLFVSVIGSFFIAGPLSKALGKRRAAMLCGVVGATFWVIPFVLRVIDVWPPLGTMQSTMLVFTFFFGANIFSVVTMMCASSMIADVVEASQERTGRRTEGIFFAGYFFTQKCATGLGIFITGLIVSFAGMPAKAVPGQVSETVTDNLTIIYCIVVVVAVAISTTIFSRFPIERHDHEARVAKLSLEG